MRRMNTRRTRRVSDRGCDFEPARPRERMMLDGAESLKDEDLVAILLSSGIKGRPVQQVAREVLALGNGNLDDLGRLPPEAFATIEGIGMAKAVSLSAAMELGRRRHKMRWSADSEAQGTIRTSGDVHRRFRERLADLGHEEFWVVALRRSNQILTEIMISRGGLTGTIADPKIIFGKALALRAAAIILVHNHPSGVARPSAADRRLTENMKKAGEFLDLPVLDHVIVARERYFSFADEGAL